MPPLSGTKLFKRFERGAVSSNGLCGGILFSLQMTQEFPGKLIQGCVRVRWRFYTVAFQKEEALQLPTADPCEAMISLLQLDMAARA